MKIIFLIDVAHWRLFGVTLSGASYIRHKKGPYSAAVRDAAWEMNGHEIQIDTYPTPSSDYPKHAHSLGQRPRFQPDLAPTEAEVVRQVLRAVKGLSPLQLEERTYGLEPMRAIVEQEERTDSPSIGTPVDFSLLKRDEAMRQWLANREARQSADPEYEAFLERERREFCDIVAID